MKHKKILYLRTDLGTENLVAGGSVTHTLGVLDGFLKQGYKIACATSAIVHLIAQRGITDLVVLRMPRVLSLLGFKINCLLSNIVFTWRVWRMYRNDASSIDCIYQRYSLLNITGVLIKKFFDRRLVLEFNGSEVWADAHWAPTKKMSLQWLIAWCEQYNLHNADQVVVVSQVLSDLLVKQGVPAEKIIVNPNGVDIDLYEPARLAGARVTTRQQYHIDDACVVGFIGTFNYWHGINILAQLIPALCAQHKNVHFMLIGNGPLHVDLVQKVAQAGLSDFVTFTGSVPSAEAQNYLSACDIFLCPTQPNPDGSRFFGSPTKLFEYMSLAKPVVASDLEQLSQIVAPALRVEQLAHYNEIQSVAGILVQPEDVKGFIDACAWLITVHENQRKNIGECARKRVVNHFTWDKHVARIIKKSNQR